MKAALGRFNTRLRSVGIFAVPLLAEQSVNSQLVILDDGMRRKHQGTAEETARTLAPGS